MSPLFYYSVHFKLNTFILNSTKDISTVKGDLNKFASPFTIPCDYPDDGNVSTSH